MTPELAALSRAYLALPGAPTRSTGRMVSLYPPTIRDDAGLLWVGTDGWLDGTNTEMLLDLTDDATGGVMTGRLHRAGIWLAEKRVSVTGGAQPTWGYWLEGGRDHYIAECDYQGEFAARVAVAAGKAG